MKNYDVTLRYSIGCRSEHQIIVILAIYWHHTAWQWHVCRKMVARLSCIYLRLVCDFFCPRSLVVIMARLSHGDRMVDVRSLAITCHFSATKLIPGGFLNMFKNQNLYAHSLSGYSSDHTNAVCLMYVYLRSLAITCRNHP